MRRFFQPFNTVGHPRKLLLKKVIIFIFSELVAIMQVIMVMVMGAEELTDRIYAKSTQHGSMGQIGTREVARNGTPTRQEMKEVYTCARMQSVTKCCARTLWSQSVAI